MAKRRTWREVDGERIEGTWRHVFIRNGDRHYLTDLFVYADAMVDCWGLGTLDEFAGKLASGRVATEIPDGAEASALHLGAWKFAEPQAWVTADALLAEVLDEVDQLNDRPDSTARCLAAVDVFLAERTEDNRAALRTAYLAIPEHLRVYALGDMDRKDWPLRVLAAGPGNRYSWRGEDEVVTDEAHAGALAYFAGHTWTPAKNVRTEQTSTMVSGVLRNDFPAPITVGTQTHPSVADAYEALRGTITPQEQTAVMAELLRLKFAQHPELAETLTATGTAPLIYQDTSSIWGRLLELIRSELAVQRREQFTSLNFSESIDRKGLDH